MLISSLPPPNSFSFRYWGECFYLHFLTILLNVSYWLLDSILKKILCSRIISSIKKKSYSYFITAILCLIPTNVKLIFKASSSYSVYIFPTYTFLLFVVITVFLNWKAFAYMSANISYPFIFNIQALNRKTETLCGSRACWLLH